MSLEKTEETGSPGWSTSYIMQTTEDVARAVVAAATSATAAKSPRPSVVFSSKDDSGGLQKFQRQVSRVLKGLSQPPEEKSRMYNPEVLTSQKRQWASFQLQSLDHRIWKEPSRLFESIVVVGLHPNYDIKTLQKQYSSRKSEGSGRFLSALSSSQNQSRVEPNLEPQVLFVYPPEKQLPLEYKDLLSFCFPGGVEVRAIERTPSMSELNEILLGQEHLKQSDMSFVFRLQVADDSTLYGCCVLIDEIVEKPSRLISMISGQPSRRPALSRHILTTRRCYCILSRLPYFELHFGVLNSIFTEERLQRLTRSMGDFDLELSAESGVESLIVQVEQDTEDVVTGPVEASRTSSSDSDPEKEIENGDIQTMEENNNSTVKEDNNDGTVNVIPQSPARKEYIISIPITESFDTSTNEIISQKAPAKRLVPHAVLPLLRLQQYESSESNSSSIQGSPIEDRTCRSEVDEGDTEEASFSGQINSNEHDEVLEWAKANNYGSLEIICEYYKLRVPARGSTIKFRPLEILQPLEFHRPDETVLRIAGSAIDLKSCATSLELADAHTALTVEEEATALSVWAIATICGSFRLEHVLTFFAGALLEKQVVVVCSNLGILSALVLSIIPLIRPYQWQSLLMPILPNEMLDFLDAPVPYIVGVKNKTNDVQSKLTNAIIVDANKNQVRSPTIPQLPQHKELFSSLSPFHSKLVGESYLGKKRPVYEYTDVQVEAAKSFLSVLRSYLDSLCSNLRAHTITNVQSNDDKVSLLLKESFIESFPSRDRPFMKQFVDTQLFSVHTDLVLSFFQKD